MAALDAEKYLEAVQADDIKASSTVDMVERPADDAAA
jgi:hypothetical protein